jgi:hypothetical protein
MPLDFVDRFNEIRVRSLIQIKSICLPPPILGAILVPQKFVEYIILNDNIFTIRMIQKIDDIAAIFGVEEISGILEYSQIHLFTKRLLNIWSGYGRKSN